MKKFFWMAAVVLMVLGACVGHYFLLLCDHKLTMATCFESSRCLWCDKVIGEPLEHQWIEADCDDPKTCSLCETTDGDPVGHDWCDATCVTAKTCSVCGESEGEPLGHTWQDATCTSPRICTVCAEIGEMALGHVLQNPTCTEGLTCANCDFEVLEPLGHSWKVQTCQSPRYCTVCGETRGLPTRHDLSEASCLAPATCASCGITVGEKADHVFISATCYAPKTCEVCGLTEGVKLEHNWVPATCTTAEYCTLCGTATGSALGHSFEYVGGGMKHCSTCGKDVTIKYAAITFDDGPSGSITYSLLNGLSARNVRSTFFVCGYRISSFPSVPSSILAYGNELALHTMDHAILTSLDKEGVRYQLESMMSMLPAGSNVTLMRPPGGACNSTVKEVCAEMGLAVVLWSVDSYDWMTGSSYEVANNIVSQVRNGSIVLVHDLKYSSVQGALMAIDILKDEGYEFVTVSELARMNGYYLAPGSVYYSIG